MTITGTIIRTTDTDIIRENLQKKNLHLKTDEQYPQTLEIEFVNDAIQKLDQFRVGQRVAVSINVRGREWVNPQGEVKVFNTLNGWKIESA